MSLGLQPCLASAAALSTISAAFGTTPPVVPRKSTGAAPATAILTSSTIWPRLISTVSTALTCLALSPSALYGNGDTVIGLKSPARTPAVRSFSTADLHTLDVVPYATRSTSASSVRTSS